MQLRLRPACALSLVAPYTWAKTWLIDGIVVAADQFAGTVTVAHRPVPGFMPAMTMQFRLRHPVELSSIASGDRVRFLFDGSYARKLTHIVPLANPE